MAKSEHELQSIVFNTFSVSYDHAVFGEFQTVPVSLTGSLSAVSLRCSFTSVQMAMTTAMLGWWQHNCGGSTCKVW